MHSIRKTSLGADILLILAIKQARANGHYYNQYFSQTEVYPDLYFSLLGGK